MRQLHSALNREHKLKHWGRLQYGLFLKGAGLGVDDAMAFWQVNEKNHGCAMDARRIGSDDNRIECAARQETKKMPEISFSGARGEGEVEFVL